MPRNPLAILQHCGLARLARKGLSEEEAIAEWEAVRDVRAEASLDVARVTEAAFIDLAHRIDADEVVRLYRPKTQADVALTFRLDEWLTGLLDAIFGAQAAVAEAGFRAALLRLSFTTSSTFIFSGRARQVATDALGLITGINDTTTARIEEVVRHGLTHGLDSATIAARLRDMLDGWTEGRAATVARTASLSVYEASQLDGYAEAGIARKAWLSNRDSNTRDDHFDADGQEVDVDASFFVGGEYLRFPGDPLGSAGNIINCRCTTRPVVESNKAWPGFSDSDMQRIEQSVRNQAIRASYRMLKKPEIKQTDLISVIADDFAVSESTVKKVLWG